MAKILVDLKDVIRALNVDEATLAKLIREEKLPAYCVAGDESGNPDGNGAELHAAPGRNDTAAATLPRIAPEAPARLDDEAPFDHRTDPGVFSVMDYNKDAVPIFMHDHFAVVFRTYETFTLVRREHAHNDSVFRRMQQVFEDFGLDTSAFDKLRGRHRVAPGTWIRTKDAPRNFDRKVNVRVSADKLRAYLVVYPGRGTGLIRREDVERELEHRKLRARADMAGVDYLLRNGLFGHVLLLAEGTPAAPGRDAVLFYHFNRRTALTPRLLENGDVDFKNLENIAMVRAGDTLITRLPAEPGEPGVDVFGSPLTPEPGRDEKLRPGTNTRVSPDGNALTAAQEGHVFYARGTVHVEEIYFVDGDVDYSVGNIDFIGIVVVNGSVREGFSVRARGDVLVNGGVEGARVQSLNGSIRVRLGVQGHNRAVLEAARSVQAKFILSATVRAGEDVAVLEAIMHSDVDAGRRVLAEGARGSIIGGVTRAQDLISARTLGSGAQTLTTLALDRRDTATGAPLRAVLDQRRRRALSCALSAEALIRNAARRLEIFGAGPDLRRDLDLKMNKYEALIKNLEHLHQEIDDLEADYGNRGRCGVRAMAGMHPNVRIHIMGRACRIQDFCPGGRIHITGRRELVHDRFGTLPPAPDSGDVSPAPVERPGKTIPGVIRENPPEKKVPA